jgi:hypothetical protein
MAADRTNHPIVHFVGGIPLPDAEAIFRTLAQAAGPYLLPLPPQNLSRAAPPLTGRGLE